MFKLLRHLAVILLIPSFGLAQKSITINSILENYYDFSSLPAYLTDTYAAQESSYDRTGNNNDGFNGTYSFTRRNEDSTLVLLNMKGPGVVNRIWTPTPTDDTLYIFIDNDNKPALTIRYRDLFTGKVPPFESPLCANQLGGFYCYLPIPFSVSCKIVLKAKQTRFHQIGYRTYPKGTVVKSFQLPLSNEEQQSLQKIKTLWAKNTAGINDFYQKPFLTATQRISLKDSKPALVFNSQKGGRILGFEIIAGADIGNIAKNIDIRIRYDQETTPAVFCPLADYFGYSFGSASMKGLMVGSDGKHHYSWFPMPYDRSATIELVYRAPAKGESIVGPDLVVKVYHTTQSRDANKEGKFYAHWNRENPVPTGKPYTMLDVHGKGHFVGVNLQAQGLTPGITGFFEGDDSTVVDGEMRMHGTGSEDFFNGGWYALLDCWDAGMSLPLSGSLEYSIPLSRTGGYRFFVADKIPFKKSFLQTIEHGPEHNRWPADYTSVSYFYNDQTYAQKVNPVASNTSIYLPDTLEIYPQLVNAAMDNFISVEAKWAYPIPAKTMFYTVKENTLLKMSLQDIPPGDYQMFLDYIMGPDAADFSLWQRQTPLTDWITSTKPATERLSMQRVADIRITTLNNSFSFQFKTPGERNKFTLNRVILVRKKS